MEKEQYSKNEIAILVDDMGKRMECIKEDLLNAFGQLIKEEVEMVNNAFKSIMDKISGSLHEQYQKTKEQLVEIKVENGVNEGCVQREKSLMKRDAVCMLNAYLDDMKQNELSDRTIEKYKGDITQWLKEAPEIIRKEDILAYKEEMSIKYKVSSVNSKVISVNRYLNWLGYEGLRVKTRRVQKEKGLENVITRENYMEMLCSAKMHNKKKIYYIMKTIAHTGIRIGELKFVTVEAIKEGSTIVRNKGKYRTVYFAESLCQELLRYCEESNIVSGIIFSGNENGKAITSGAVWKGLKNIARQTDVPENTVYPHSFRHLFAKEYMRTIGDISELADLLGHSRLETTWIYTKTTSDEKRSKLELLDL